MRTTMGGCLSMVIVYVTFLFAVMKLMDVFVHKSPIVISNEDVNPD